MPPPSLSLNASLCVTDACGLAKIRTPMFVEELGEAQDEVRMGLWEAGDFVEVKNLNLRLLVVAFCQSVLYIWPT